MRILRNLVVGVIGAALVIDSISGVPSLVARLRKWNDWLHSHLSSQLGGLIGGILLGLTLALLFVQLYLWHRASGSTVHKKLAGFAFLGAIGSALLIALPFFSAEKDKVPPGAEADIHAIGENRVVVAASGGHEKAIATSHHHKPGSESDSGSQELASDVQPTEVGGPAAEASSTECGCSSNQFVKQEPKMGQWKQPVPAPQPENQPSEEFFKEEGGHEPEEEEEFFGPEEEEFEGTGSPSTVSSSSSSSSSSVTVTSSNSSVSVNSTGGGSETVVTSTSESTSSE